MKARNQLNEMEVLHNDVFDALEDKVTDTHYI